MLAPVGTFELQMGFLADFTEDLFLLWDWRIALLIILLDQINLLVLLYSLGGNVVTFLLLHIGRSLVK